MIIEGYNLFMTRGDTEYFTINIFEGDEPYVLQVGDIVSFTVRPWIESDKVCIEKIIETPNVSEVKFEIESIDTDNMARGDYVYDIEIKKANGDTTTIIPPPKEVAMFCIGGDISRG